MTEILNILSNPYLLAITGLLLALFISVRMHEVIIYLAVKKNLMDVPGLRSAHTKNIPNLGGVGIFIAFSLCMAIIGGIAGLVDLEFKQLLLLLAATTILFFLGVKDDLIGLSPKKKFIGQIIAAALIVLLTDVRIESLEGLFGITVLPYFISVGISIFIFVFVINAFNLIDGIDGLAGTTAILASAIFGMYFLFNGFTLMVLLSFVLIGSIIGFLKYNLAKKRKLFMGDCGSLFVGFLVTYQAIFFLSNPPVETLDFAISNKILLVFAILVFPMIDTLRVFLVRIIHRKSPFAADRNHLHHLVIDAGLTHKQATLFIVTLNAMLIVLMYALDGLNIHLQLIFFSMGLLAVGTVSYFVVLQKNFIRFTVSKLIPRVITNFNSFF